MSKDVLIPNIKGMSPRSRPGVFFDFSGPLVDAPMRKPDVPPGPRSLSDYKHLYSPYPPNLLRTLLSEPAIVNLQEGFSLVDQKYPGRFRHFDIHSRSLFKNIFSDNRNKRVELLPWDVLTYVNFDGFGCYAPVDVSFSHQIMTCNWDPDPKLDLTIKRGIVEMQIDDIIQQHQHGPQVDIYGLSIPEQFTHGNTNKIFTEYPHFYGDLDWYASMFKCIVKDITVNGQIYKIYLFPGKHISRDTFEEKVSDPAFVYYCEAISSRWNANFTNLIGQATKEDGNVATQSRYWILSCLGANPDQIPDINPQVLEYCLG